MNSEELSRANWRAHDALLTIVKLLESHEIVYPDTRSTIQVFSEEMGHLREAFGRFYSKALLHVRLPPQTEAQIPGTPAIPMQPSIEQLEELKSLSKQYVDTCWNLVGYIIDFRIEAQNNLLGGFFDEVVPGRVPLDTSVKTLSQARTEGV